MFKKQRNFKLLGAILLLTTWAPVQAVEVTPAGQAGSSNGAAAHHASPTAPAPILHRRTTLPAGWFKSGQRADGALTDTKVETDGVTVKPVVHFDTDGDTDGQGAANRLQRVRDAVLFQDLKKPGVAKRTPSQSAGEPTSSRRSQLSTSAANEQPQVVQSEDDSVDATLVSPRTIVTTEAETPTVESPLASADESAAPLTQPLQLNASAEPTRLGTELAADDARDDDRIRVATLPDATTELPSVMKQATPRADLSQGVQADRMRLVTIDEDAAKTATTSNSAPAERLTASPMVELSSAPQENPTDTILTKHGSPMLSVVTRGPNTIVVGKASTFLIDLRNQSDVPAKDVVVRVNIPQWVEVVQQNPSHGAAHIQPNDSGQSVLSWQISHVGGRSQEKLMLDLIPRGSRPVDLGVAWTFSPATSTTQIQVQEPKITLSVVGPQDVLYGETKVYTITVSNPGTGDAENVVLNLLPLVPGERTAGVRNLGTIAAGTRRTMEVELTTRQTGRLHVRAEVAADGGLHAQAHQDVLVRRAILEVAVDGPPMKYAGTRGRYTVRVINTGDAAATDVGVVATLPAGSKDVASSDGGSLDPNTGQVQWQVGVLRPGASRVLDLECMLTAAGDNRMDVRAVAAGDLSALGATITEVESLADLKLTVNDPQGAVAVGADMAYEVRVVNRGTKEASNIQLYGYFSEGVEPVSIAGWRGQINEGEVVLQTIPRLGPGQEMVIRLAAQANRSGDHVFRAELECSDPETKLAVEEWTRFYGELEPTSEPGRPKAATAAKPLKLQRY